MTGSSRSAARSAARVATLLEAQSRALLDGDIARLAAMLEDLDRALEMLMQSPPPRQDLARLSIRAARNAELVRAAQKGLAQIFDRRSGRDAAPLTTYDNAGRCAAHLPAGRTLSRG